MLEQNEVNPLSDNLELSMVEFNFNHYITFFIFQIMAEATSSQQYPKKPELGSKTRTSTQLLRIV